MGAINIRLVLRAPTLTLPRYAGEGICFSPRASAVDLHPG